MPLPLIQVDAFTAAPFAGNPAAVCLLDAPRAAAWMQRVAHEMNLSETAFVRLDTAPLAGEASGEAAAFGLRWFTPTHEVDLCGHATLAAAHALWTTGHADPAAPLAFATASGRLTARRGAPGDEDAGRATSGAGWITLDFPADPPVSAEAPPALLDALGLRAAAYVGRTGRDLFVQVDAPAAVRTLQPDLARLAALDARGVIVTAPGDDATGRDAANEGATGRDTANEGANAEGTNEGADADGADFVSRFFAPAVGVPEDPVTGSAHCALAPFWAERLGRARLVGRQLSARGGTVRVHARGARVALGGQAVTVLRGTLVC